MSYEPATPGPGVFLGEALREGVRFNHGNIPEMTREEFWPVAFGKLFGSDPPAGLTPTPKDRWKWKFWK